MGQTVRRQPGEVDIPSKDYIYHKNLIGFKGLDTRENPLVTDPLSCSDAENVWVDSNGNLTTRPRLQYVRQNLKHANAEVVNVIYTDNAYWTLYIKDAVYYLTRTDLATDTETDFTIPTITSPKIAITEYKNVYYLGCSAGYYSCNAGNTAFHTSRRYIPMGHITDNTFVYDEPRNILNDKINIAQFGGTTVLLPPGTIHGSFAHYAIYSMADTETSRHIAIWDLFTGQDVAILAYGVPVINRSTLAIWVDDSLICIGIFKPFIKTVLASVHAEIRITAYTLDNGVLTKVLDYDIDKTDHPVNVWMRAPFLNEDETKQNTFCGIRNSANASWTRLEWSTERGHILLNASYSYLQWDYAHATNRIEGPAPTADTGQECDEALQFDITELIALGYNPDSSTAVSAGFIRRVGLNITAEHSESSTRTILAHLSLVNSAITPARNYMLIQYQSVTTSSVSDAIASNSGVYRSNNSTYWRYICPVSTRVASSYPRSDMEYQHIALTLPSNANVVCVEGLDIHEFRVYTFYNSDKLIKQQTVSEAIVFQPGGTPGVDYAIDVDTVSTVLSNVAEVGNALQTPYIFLVTAGANKYAYTLPVHIVADLTAIGDVITAGFTCARGSVLYSTTSQTNFYAYTVLYKQETDIRVTAENPSLRGVLFLDNVYWWFGKTNIYGTANEDLTYMPESRKLDAPSEIRNWVRLTDTSFLVFCESDTCLYYKDTSSGLWLRTVLNLPFEILYPDETSESCYAALNTGPTYVTRNGIYEIALSENLFTNERQAQNISDPLTTLQGGLLRKLIPSIAHLQTVRYKDWQLYIFTRANATKTEIIAQEIATYNFFYWTLPIVFQSVYLAHSQVYLVTKKATTYTFSETELLREYKNGSTVLAAIKCYGDEVYDTVKKTTSLNQIDWHWHSAIINLDTVQYYKTLLALIFGMNDYDDESRIMFEYRTDIYYKSHTEQPTQVYDDYVYKIRATQKPMAIPRFMYIRVRISSVKVPENEDCLPEEFMCKANLSQLTFKYKVLRGPLL